MRIKRILPLLLLPLALVGCGGQGGSGTVGGTSPLVATFRSNFTRGVSPNTTLVIFVDNKGHAGVQIDDTTGVQWVGQGTFIGNSLNVSLQAIGESASGNVFCHGVLVSGVPPTMNITLSGAVTSTSTATEIAGLNVFPAAGHYSGDYSGSENGTFDIQVADNGSVTGTLNSPAAGDNLSVLGATQIDGSIVFHFQVIGFNATYRGYLFLPPNSTLFKGAGTWDFNAFSGEWDASQLATP